MDIINIQQDIDIVGLALINELSKNWLQVYDTHINKAYDEFWFKWDPCRKAELLGKSALALLNRSAVAQECLRTLYASIGIEYTPKQVPEDYDVEIVKVDEVPTGEIIMTKKEPIINE